MPAAYPTRASQRTYSCCSLASRFRHADEETRHVACAHPLIHVHRPVRPGAPGAHAAHYLAGCRRRLPAGPLQPRPQGDGAHGVFPQRVLRYDQRPAQRLVVRHALLVGDRGAWLTTPTTGATARTPGWSSSQTSRGCQRVGAARGTWPRRAARNGPRSGGRGAHSCHHGCPPPSARGDRGDLIPHAGWSIR